MIANGTLMSGLNVRPNRNDKDMLIYPGAYQMYPKIKRKVTTEKLKQKKFLDTRYAASAIDNEIINFINNNENTQQLKDEISYNKERKKTKSIGGALGAITAGAGAGALGSLGMSAAFSASGAPKAKRVSEALNGVKAATSHLGKSDLKNRLAARMVIPAAGAGLGLVAGGYAAHKINEAKRNRLVGPKKTEALNEVSYALDNHMREKDTIKRIAGNSTRKALSENFDLYRKGLQYKQALDIINTSFEKIAGFPIEKEAGLKRDLRIARAEANSEFPRLMQVDGDKDTYRKQMAGYADSVESFLNSSDKNQDWKTKLEMAKLNQKRGYSSREKGDIAGSYNVRSFVESRIADKHNKGVVRNRDTDYRLSDNINDLMTYKFDDITNRSPLDYFGADQFNNNEAALNFIRNERGRYNDPTSKAPVQIMAESRNRAMNSRDERLIKQTTSGQHKLDLIDPKGLYDGKTYFKTHSSNSPFNIGGGHLRRGLNGAPTQTKNGIPIWASKLPEISSEYGDSMVAFVPNKNMLSGASATDHPHLAKDTRRMSNNKIKKQKVFNSSYEQNHNPEYERVFTYNKKNMDKSISSTYKRVGAGTGKTHSNNYHMVKNKPGSLADKLVKDIVNGDQMDFIDGKKIKKLDRAHLKRRAQQFAGNPNMSRVAKKQLMEEIANTMPSKIREYDKASALRKNVLGGLGTATAVAGLGAIAYNDLKKAKQRKEFMDKKKKEEAKNN